MTEPDADAVDRLPAQAAQRPGLGLGGVPVVVAVTVALAILATALAAMVAGRLSHRNAVADARVAALGAATSGVATVLSYDYRTLDKNFAKAESLLTPHFRKLYDATTARGVKPLAAKYRAVSSADVTAGGVVQASGSRAVVLVLVSQTVTNSQLAAPRLDRSRINVTLVHRGGRWLIDGLDPI